MNTREIDFSPASGLAYSGAEGGFRDFYAAKVDSAADKASEKVLVRTDDKTFTAKDFYRDMFAQQVMKADMRAVFTEYAWDLNACGPCAADPLYHEELLSLGVFWLTETPPDFVLGRGSRPIMPPMGGGRDDVFDTHMLAGHDGEHVPEPTGRKLAWNRQQMNLHSAEAGNDRQRWLRLWTS